mgnify:CR=1 FL=1|jgi:hypothetical protein
MNYYGQTQPITLIGYITTILLLITTTTFITIFKFHTETITPTLTITFLYLIIQFGVTNYIGYKEYPNSLSKVLLGTMIMGLSTVGTMYLFNNYITPNYLKKDEEIPKTISRLSREIR